eukprot:GGOE01036140.1.p3 GENE.GGOE01036140.1~~GGOE01036140.1.p3  ORF type:complete len:155 (-),score=28.73 GGOE01036140.1:215-640(-)
MAAPVEKPVRYYFVHPAYGFSSVFEEPRRTFHIPRPEDYPRVATHQPLGPILVADEWALDIVQVSKAAREGKSLLPPLVWRIPVQGSMPEIPQHCETLRASFPDPLRVVEPVRIVEYIRTEEFIGRDRLPYSRPLLLLASH